MTRGRAEAMGPASNRPGTGVAPGEQGGLRRSHALLSLASHFDTTPPMQVLDLGGLNQQNLDFVTGFNHRLYAGDLVTGYESLFTAEQRQRGDAGSDRMELFLQETLPFREGELGAVLAWDRLQFMFPLAASALVGRLKHLMAPGALLMALFHPESLSSTAPLTCRASGDGSLVTAPRPPARTVETFNARSIEKLFSEFSSVKFYMTRDSLQEVLIRR